MTGQPHREWVYRMAYEMGRHIVGYEVQKVLAAVDWLAGQRGKAKTGVVGYGEGGLLALYAAALDTRIAGATIERSIESWIDIVATPHCREQLMQVVPLALTCYDLPDLVTAIAPRPVTIRNPVDATGKPKPTK